MPTENFRIIVSQSGARTVSRDLRNIASGSVAAQKGAQGLNRTLQLLASAAVGRGLITLADGFTVLNNRTKVFARSAEDAATRVSEISRIAIQTRAPLDATATVFQRLSLIQDSTGLSTQNLVDVTETLTKAVAVSGATAQEAEGALRQLAQGIAANRLSGQEFNAVAEQTPRIALAIADSLGVQIGALRGLANEGKLTAAVVLEAFKSQADIIDKEFSKVDVTFGQAFTNIRTAATLFVGSLNEQTGAGKKVIATLQGISKWLVENATNSEKLAAGLNNIGTAIAFIIGLKFSSALASMATQAVGLVTQFGLMVATNPFALIGVAIAGTLALLFRFRNEVVEIGGQTFRIQDLAKAIGIQLANAAVSVADKIRSWKTVAIVVLRVMKVLTNILIALWISTGRVIFAVITRTIEAFKQLPGRIASITAAIPRLIQAQVLGDSEAVGRVMSEAMADGLLGGAVSKIGDDMAMIFSEEAGVDHLGNAFDFVADTAAKAAEATGVLAVANQLYVDSQKESLKVSDEFGRASIQGPALPPGFLSDKAFAKLQKQVVSLRGEMDPVVALTTEMTERLTLLDTALQHNVISFEQFQQLNSDVYEAFQLGLDELNFDKLTGLPAVIAGGQDAIAQMAEEIGGPAQQISDIMGGAIDGLTDSILGFVQTGKFAWKDLASSVLTQIQRMIIKMLVMKAIQAGLSAFGGGGGGLNSLGGTNGTTVPQRAHGGLAQAGGQIMVGERGPELFTPAQSGSITSNEALRSQSQPQGDIKVVNLVDEEGIAKAMESGPGERAILNRISANGDVVRQAGA